MVNDAVKSKKLKYLRQKVKRQAKKIASMKMVISSLKQNNLLNNDELELFTEQFVAINESWKIPMGYFLCNHLNSSQKSELIQQCLNLINKTGIKVVNLTFDGCASNINMSKLLGCDLDPTSF
ncbi:hypothetical protein QTP88_024396 [Uroleucon formosanum]